MQGYGALFLCLLVCFCILPFISGRILPDATFAQNVKFELSRKCDNLERDFEKDFEYAKYKLAKSASKMIKKGLKQETVECIESSRVQAVENLDERAQELLNCIQEIKDTLDTDLASEATVGRILSFRSQVKNSLNDCKKLKKLQLKSAQNDFAAAGKNCLI